MSLNLLDPTTYTSAVYITDTINLNGFGDTIPPFPTRQVNGINTPVSAAFAISSKEGGLFLDGITTTQRNNLNPKNGLLVNNNTTNTFDVYLNNNWTQLATGGENYYGPGNPLYLSHPAGNSMGITTDAAYTATAGGNIRIGQNSVGGQAVGAGDNNTIVGMGAIPLATGNVSSGVYLGYGVASTTTTSLGNTVIGFNALSQSADGVGLSVIIGYEAAYGANIPATFGESVYVGYNAGYGSNASNSVGVGASALSSLIANGAFGTALGYQALKFTNADGNTGVGYNAGTANVGGINSVFMGSSAGASYTTYDNCVLVGQGAEVYVAAGGDPTGQTQYSVAIGQNTQAGNSAQALGAGAQAQGTSSIAIGDGGVIAEGDQSIAIGFLANAIGTGSVALGPNAAANGDNCIVLGAPDYNVGIGLPEPAYPLHVVQSNTSQTAAPPVAAFQGVLLINGASPMMFGQCYAAVQGDDSSTVPILTVQLPTGVFIFNISFNFSIIEEEETNYASGTYSVSCEQNGPWNSSNNITSKEVATPRYAASASYDGTTQTLTISVSGGAGSAANGWNQWFGSYQYTIFQEQPTH